MKQYSLVGVDGNVFNVIGYVINAMRESHCSLKERSDFQKNILKLKSYEDVVNACMDELNKLNERNQAEYVE